MSGDSGRHALTCQIPGVTSSSIAYRLGAGGDTATDNRQETDLPTQTPTRSRRKYAAADTPPEGVGQFMHDVITGEGFTYEVDYRHDHGAIREEDGVRIQIRAETVPNKQQVKRLAEAIKAGAKLDLMAITEDEYRVYGNHRFEGYKVAGQHIVPVIIINVRAETADDDVLTRLRIIGIRENSRHGLQNSNATNDMAVVLMRRQGWDNTRIARDLGVKPNRVSEIVAVDKGVNILADLGYGADTRPTKTVCAAIGRASEELNKGPLEELVKLAVDADLAPKEIRTLAAAAKDARADTDALALIEEERESLRTRVSGTNTRPTYASQLRQRLGWIVNKAGNAQLLVEHSAASAQSHLDMVNAAIDVLTEVRDGQQAVVDDDDEEVGAA